MTSEPTPADLAMLDQLHAEGMSQLNELRQGVCDVIAERGAMRATGIVAASLVEQFGVDASSPLVSIAAFALVRLAQLESE